MPGRTSTINQQWDSLQYRYLWTGQVPGQYFLSSSNQLLYAKFKHFIFRLCISCILLFTHILHCAKYIPQSWCVSLDKAADDLGFFYRVETHQIAGATERKGLPIAPFPATTLLLLKKGRQPAALLPHSLPLENASSVQEGPEKA